MTKCQKDPTCGTFLKRGLFKDMKKIIFPCVKRTNTKIQIYKYTNTAYDKVPERPSMWYNTVAVLSLCQLSIVECSKSSKDFCTEIHPGFFYPKHTI